MICFKGLIIYFLIVQCDGRILRVPNEFFGQFTLVDSDQRIKANCIQNITKTSSLQECVKKCLTEQKCQSFNRHRKKGFCELLAISKFNETGLLQRDKDWVHYETDDDEQNVGPVCSHLSPCQPYEICEVNLKKKPAYYCRCRDGFNGTKCQNYEGPGTEKSNPAASCKLLMLQFKSVPDGEYWFKGKNSARFCERRVDGGLTQWSLFGPCNFTVEKRGIQKRNRSCINPTPKGGGRSCDHLGHQQESRPCQCTYNFFTKHSFVLKQKLFGTFSKVLSEYRMKLQLRVFTENLMIGHWHNILFILTGRDHDNGIRQPALWMRNPIDSDPFISVNAVVNEQLGRYYTYRSEQYFNRRWHTVEVSQKKLSNGSYVFEVSLNQVKAYTIINKKAEEFENMEFWMAKRNNIIRKAFVRNLFLDGFCDLQREEK